MADVFFERVKSHKANLSSEDINFNEIVESSFFHDYLQDLVNSLTLKKTVPVKLFLIRDDNKGQVQMSGTDGEKMYINPDNKLIQNFVAYENKIFGILGLLFHESAHIRYLDFKGESEAVDKIKNGEMPFSKPDCSTEKESRELSELLAAIKKKESGAIFLKLYSSIAGVISDYHDEEKLCKEHGPLVRKSILTIREGLFGSIIALENMEGSDEYTPLSIMMSLLLQYSRFGKVLTLREETLHKSYYIDILKKSAVYIDIARETDNIEIKFNSINAVVLNLWIFIAEALKKEETMEESKKPECENCEDCEGCEGGKKTEESDEFEESKAGEDEESEGGDGDGEGTPSQVGEEILNQMEKAVSSCGGNAFSNPPKNVFGEISLQTILQEDSLEKDYLQETDLQSPDGMIKNVIDNIISDLLDDKAEELSREEQYNDALMKIRTENMSSIHAGICVNMKMITAEQLDKNFYEKIINKNIFFIKKLRREVEKIIQEEDVTILKHRYYGRKIDAKSTFKVDQRYFTQKKNPEKLLDMAIAILVDNSGSMEGSRICAAKEAAVLLTEVLELLGIPALVAGHACKDALCFSIFKNFEDVKSAKFSISRMMSSGDNRDGMALDIAGNLLADRFEKNKLLIIISDGQPNSHGYTGSIAKKDIKEVVKRYKQMGIKTLAFAIGDDKHQIKEIYGDAYIDISDLEKFPKTLSKIIEKEIISNI